ncbi:GTP-binding protein, partial [Pisolithus sp. B1]
ILVMGRAHAGKTTILQRVCNTMNKPEIFDREGNRVYSYRVVHTGIEHFQHGHHSMEHELVFRSNPHFVFHDSCGFEAGSTKQFDEMKNFVVNHAATAKSVNEQIHAIWYCIPMTDCQRMVTADEKFFNECDTKYVPVVVLLTKGDGLWLDAIQELEDEGYEIEEASENITGKERKLLEKWLAHIKLELHECRFPPSGYVSLQNMEEKSADCTALMQCTADVLNDEGLQRLLISTQQSSIMLCVKYAVGK